MMEDSSSTQEQVLCVYVDLLPRLNHQTVLSPSVFYLFSCSFCGVEEEIERESRVLEAK